MNRKAGFALAALISTLLTGAQDETSIEKDITYGTVDGVELRLDLARPPGKLGPYPLVVCFHGGGWRAGDRASYHPVLRALADQGFVAATASYRLAPRYKFPAQIEDAKCAVRFLRAHAKEYQINPARVAAAGDSAGGHLALLLGLTDLTDGMEGKGGYADQSSKVQAVINYYGPVDFSTWHVDSAAEAQIRQQTQRGSDEILVDFLGTADRKDAIMAKVSPISYVRAGAPPILTFHGTKDLIVPLAQARILHQTLKKAGATEQLEEIENAGHGIGDEDRERTNYEALTFLNKHLK